MLVSEIGEFGLIKLLAAEFGIDYPATGGGMQTGLLVGLGDDAVVTRRRDGALVWTTDTMVADVHFLTGRTAWLDVGWKALAVNLSDVAAMGAIPYLALVTLMLPADFCVEDAVETYRGLYQAATAFGVTLGGGDIVRGPVFAVTVALCGWALATRLGSGQVMTRTAARRGDIVAVSGSIGESAGGLLLLKEGSRFDGADQQVLRRRHERPTPRIELGQAAVRAGVRCAIDVSDGLVQDLGHVARASGVTLRADANRVPLSSALTESFPGRALGLALTGGEDYELVLIGSRLAIDELIATSETPLSEIGEVVAVGAVGVDVVDETGRVIPMGSAGWDHFGA